ncbi:MAG: VCBS repeat-containing protein, partial [Spartobacteria bacterium]|nr:VCBS repeat-containing protein [Spartobacteria bacterium]
MINSVLVGNQAVRGGGIAGLAGGYLAHCTVVSNSAARDGGGIYSHTAITSWNNVVYYNLAPIETNVGSTFKLFENNCTMPDQGGSNFTNAPAFVDFAGRDFRLAEGSPCIDAGAAAPAVAADYDGIVRPRSGAVGSPARYDVGAFEYVRPAGAAAGDFNGDGVADGAVFRPADGNWIFQYSGAGGATQAFGSRTMVPVPADYDGDGRVDVALYRPSSGEWFILNSGGGSRRPTFGPNSTMIPLPGDYDGDGRADLALFYPASSRWYFFGSTEEYSSVQFGGRADIPVPADYDGDGVTDVAVYRPSNDNWYLIYSGGGSRVTQLGWAGTVPVPADYDGDGRADV